MGIPKFFEFIKRRFRASIITTSPARTDNLYIDANSLLHEAAQRAVGYGDYKDIVVSTYVDEIELHRAIYSMFLKGLDEIVRVVKPTNLLYIAIDGPPPKAKIVQQRHRRFDSPPKEFDTRKISPGTKFMFDFDSYINANIELLKAEWKKNDILPEKILYSPHVMFGEGEHKLMENLRGQTDTSTNVIYGNDADLIVLTMLTQKNCYVMRENNYGNARRRKVGLDEDPEITAEYTSDYIIVDIYVVLNELKLNYNMVSPLDFLVLTLFIGNDFLPRMVDFEDPHPTQDRYVRDLLVKGKTYNLINLIKLLNIYKNIVKNRRRLYLVDKTHNTIRTENFRALLKEIVRNELKLWEDRLANNNEKNPSLLIKDATSIKREKKNPIDVLDPRSVRYYHNYRVFTVTDEKWTDKRIDKFNIEEMVYKWIEGCDWVLKYYTEGINGVDKDWIYNFHYSPMLYDVYTFYKPIQSKLGYYSKNITPVQQLLAILPPSGEYLLPESAKEIQRQMFMIYPDEIYEDIYNVKLNRKGEIQEYLNEKLTPFYNFSLMLKYYDNIKNNRDIVDIDNKTITSPYNL